MNPKSPTSFTALLKAQKNFEAFRQNLNTDQEKAGAIQAFEYSFELAWKIMKRLLEAEQSQKIFSIKDVFRFAAQYELIDSPEIWFEFLEQRNLTSHTYDEEIAEELIQIFPKFSTHLALFITRAQQRLTTS